MESLPSLTAPSAGSDNVLLSGANHSTAFLQTVGSRRSEQRGQVLVITIENVRDFPARARGAYVTVGNFDGVHLGHQRLLSRVCERADRAGVPALAITFDPHPVALLRPDKAPVPLVWPEREVALLRQAGATEVGVFRTGPWLLDLSAREFFDRVIRDQLAARGMVEGPNFAFGHDRQGNVSVLEAWCADAGIDFQVVDPTVMDDRLVSSTLIRECLQDGRSRDAARFLSRPHRIRGVVERGAGRGAGLGFPTINLTEIDVLVPALGVYAGVGWIDGRAPRGRRRATLVRTRPSETPSARWKRT